MLLKQIDMCCTMSSSEGQPCSTFAQIRNAIRTPPFRSGWKHRPALAHAKYTWLWHPFINSPVRQSCLNVSAAHCWRGRNNVVTGLAMAVLCSCLCISSFASPQLALLLCAGIICTRLIVPWHMMTAGQGSLTGLLSALPWRYLSLSRGLPYSS